MNERNLNKYLHRKATLRQKIAFLAVLPAIALASYFLMSRDFGATPENPGGSYFETAFWLTAVGSSVLSFIILEVLFRSKETRLLASWPVNPGGLFLYQMRRVFTGIALSTIPYLALWLPQIPADPVVVSLSILLWPAGLISCAIISAAVILYTGNEGAAHKSDNASFGAISFSMAPAISLAISLIITLVLKLLAEAILKPGFFNAAVTAVLISAGISAISFIYAYHLYKKRYYAILASFLDTDMIQINAGYEFLDDRTAKHLRKQKSQDSLITCAFETLYWRSHPASSILIWTSAVILSLLLINQPDYLSSPFIPLLFSAPWIFFSKPWFAFESPDFQTGFLDAQPISPHVVRKAKTAACFRILVRHGGILSLAALIAYAFTTSWSSALLNAGLTFAICAAFTLIFTLIAPKFKRPAT